MRCILVFCAVVVVAGYWRTLSGVSIIRELLPPYRGTFTFGGMDGGMRAALERGSLGITTAWPNTPVPVLPTRIHTHSSKLCQEKPQRSMLWGFFVAQRSKLHQGILGAWLFWCSLQLFIQVVRPPWHKPMALCHVLGMVVGTAYFVAITVCWLPFNHL